MLLICGRARAVARYALRLDIRIRRSPNYSRFVATKPIVSGTRIESCGRIASKGIHTSRRLDIPPALALIVRPLVNVAAFLFGRYFKRWWARQTPAQREVYKKWLASKRGAFLGILAAFLSGLGVYYVHHLETDPLTHRRRFIILNEEQQAALAQAAYETSLEEFKHHLVPPSHPAYKRVLAVVKTLLHANKDLPFVADESWTLNVIDDKAENAYVLPGGHIFVLLGLLNIVENDDQLAVILSHEIAHVVLKHSIEQISYGVILDILLLIPLAALWAMFPDLVAFILQDLAKGLLAVIVKLPYSRALEKEADEIGLKLAARACVDVREAAAFWATMKILADMDGEHAEHPWLSTHPHHEEREKFLDALMSHALDLRTASGCKNVPRFDPRNRLRQRTVKEQEEAFRTRGFMLNPNR